MRRESGALELALLGANSRIIAVSAEAIGDVPLPAGEDVTMQVRLGRDYFALDPVAGETHELRHLRFLRVQRLQRTQHNGPHQFDLTEQVRSAMLQRLERTDFGAELFALAQAGTLTVDVSARPLADVTSVWSDPDPAGTRTVLVP